MLRLFFLLIPALLCAQSFTSDLWKSTDSIHARTLAQPFLKGLADGSLPQESFRFYLLQDSLYLHEYSAILHALAAKAPRKEWADFLNQGAEACLKEEMNLHREYFRPEEVQRARPGSTNRKYLTFMATTVKQGTFAEGLAAVLPCYWVYWEVGQVLAKKGSPNKDYQKWIAQYSDPAYGKSIATIRQIMDEAVSALDSRARARIQSIWQRGVQFESDFWAMGWNRK